jgi:hypothetical protein
MTETVHPSQPSPIVSPLDHPPAIVFIVPYRDREPHKHFFSKYMNETVMADYVKNRDYAIYFVEQKDMRPFNRGAMKNIGFLALKYKYPLNYKDITFVFNDVDTVPYKNILDYRTTHGVIKHFYGFTFALGGIFSITGADFERIGGFPNFWSWGFEDNYLLKRVIENRITVDRSQILDLFNKDIIHLQHGFNRSVNKEASQKTNLNPDTLSDIKNIAYLYSYPFLNVDNFSTIHKSDINIGEIDLRNGNPTMNISGRKTAGKRGGFLKMIL